MPRSYCALLQLPADMSLQTKKIGDRFTVIQASIPPACLSHVMACSQLSTNSGPAEHAWNRYNSRKSKQTSCHAMPKIIRSGRLDRYPQVILLQGLSRRTGSLTVCLDKPQKATVLTRSGITQTLVPQVPQSTFFKKISKKKSHELTSRSRVADYHHLTADCTPQTGRQSMSDNPWR
jgi:hypothetical protein